MPNTNSTIYTGTWTDSLDSYSTAKYFSTQNAESGSTTPADADVDGEFIQGVSITNNTDEIYTIDVKDGANFVSFAVGTRLLPRTTLQLFTANDKIQLSGRSLKFELSGPTGQEPYQTSNSGQVCAAVTYTIRRS